MSLSDFPWTFFSLFQEHAEQKHPKSNLKGNHWSRQKIFILSWVCIEMCSRLVLSKVSEQVKWCHKFPSQNKYTFLSQRTLSFIELENLFKMFFFCPFSVASCQKPRWHDFLHRFLLSHFTAFQCRSWRKGQEVGDDSTSIFNAASNVKLNFALLQLKRSGKLLRENCDKIIRCFSFNLSSSRTLCAPKTSSTAFAAP